MQIQEQLCEKAAEADLLKTTESALHEQLKVCVCV